MHVVLKQQPVPPFEMQSELRRISKYGFTREKSLVILKCFVLYNFNDIDGRMTLVLPLNKTSVVKPADTSSYSHDQVFGFCITDGIDWYTYWSKSKEVVDTWISVLGETIRVLRSPMAQKMLEKMKADKKYADKKEKKKAKKIKELKKRAK